MKFSEFLLKEEQINNDNSDFIKKYSDIILNLIKKDNNDILVVNSLYIKNNKDVSDILKDDLLSGYFIYNSNEQDDNNYYVGHFDFDPTKNNIKIELEVSDPCVTLNDTELYIKNKLKGFKLD
jgi:hypothetical protein